MPTDKDSRAKSLHKKILYSWRRKQKKIILKGKKCVNMTQMMKYENCHINRAVPTDRYELEANNPQTAFCLHVNEQYQNIKLPNSYLNIRRHLQQEKMIFAALSEKESLDCSDSIISNI